MLQSLSIKNAALISSLNICLSSGLNVLSGETGAGKSIIVDSLNFVLGSKADKTLIRHGTDKMTAEAVFCVPEHFLESEVFEQLGICETTVIIYRAFGADGRGEIRVNGRAVTLSMLKSLTSKLADVYGQSEHISLLSSAVQLDILDEFFKQHTAPLKQQLSTLCAQLKQTEKKLSQIGGSDRERIKAMELYAFQSEEIAAAALVPGEEQEIKDRRLKYINIQRITEEITTAYSALTLEEGGGAAASTALSCVQRAVRYDGGLEEISSRLNSVVVELDDIAQTLKDYLYSSEFDEAEAARTESRLELIKSLKRKYGDSIEEILEYKRTIDASLEELEQSEERMAALTADREKLLKEIYALSAKLSAYRQKSAAEFKGLVTKNLEQLSMKGTQFDIEFAPLPEYQDAHKYVSAGGMDSIDFLISPNPGQPLKSLSKIISGGEMSRFMLAVKNITRDTDNIPTLVFDEIDAGISGETALSVAKKFADISRSCQVIAITHLPQIAAMGDANFLIQKTSEGSSTITDVVRITGESLATEIARLTGGAQLSEHALPHARKMLDWSSKYKLQNSG